jgi:hypothetical protein
MAAAGDVLLIDAGSVICSGAPMFLNAREHSQSVNAYWAIPQAPAKSTGSSYNIRLAQGKYTGFDNPHHMITGVYDDSGTSYDNFTSLTNKGYYYITGSMLKGIMLAGTMFALIDKEVIHGSIFGGGSMVYVAPISAKSIRTPLPSRGSGSEGYAVNYSIELQEIQV